MKSYDQVSNPENEPRHRIRSFVRREGRMTPGQRRALDALWFVYGLELEDGMVDLARLFGREAPRILEIGFGMGASLLVQADENADQDFIGIEVYRPGVGAMLQGLQSRGLTNVRLYCTDAVEVLQRCIPGHSLDRVQLYFPDPWPKRRHNKRRLVQSDFVELVSQRLRPGGCLHMATDSESYAGHMLALLEAQEGLSNAAERGCYVPRPAWRPQTKYEKRGQGLGHAVWDLIFLSTN